MTYNYLLSKVSNDLLLKDTRSQPVRWGVNLNNNGTLLQAVWSVLTSHGGDPQSDSDGEFNLRSLKNITEWGWIFLLSYCSHLNISLPYKVSFFLLQANNGERIILKTLLTAAIMMALSRKPNPIKGTALWNKTKNQQEEKKQEEMSHL